MAAIEAQGAVWGQVVQVHDYGGGPSLEIVGGGKSLIVPFTKGCVPTVDLTARMLTVTPPVETEVSLPSGKGWDEGVVKAEAHL